MVKTKFVISSDISGFEFQLDHQMNVIQEEGNEIIDVKYQFGRSSDEILGDTYSALILYKTN